MTALPVADRATVRREARALLAADRGGLAAVLLFTAAASAAATVAPWLVGTLVDGVVAGRVAVDPLALAILAAAIARLLLDRSAQYTAARVGERAGARLREAFVDRVLALPPAVVERAGTGDLMTRSSADVTAVVTTLRDALPDVVVAAGQILFVVGAMVVLNPLIGLCAVVGVPVMVAVGRWYLRRAGPAYLAEGATMSRVAEEVAVTVEGARTVEALGLGAFRIAAADAVIDESRAARRRTLGLRNVLYPVCELAYVLPTAAILLVGGVLGTTGVVSIGAVVAGSLYSWQLTAPVDTVLARAEMLQSASASFARVTGIGRVPTDGPDAAPATRPATTGGVQLRGVHHAYVAGRDVLHGIDLAVAPGERLAVVGPSGAGKSTLGRLVAGIDPPRAGSVTVGGDAVAGLPSDERRRRVVMVTQEHHVFLGTLRDNLTLAAETASDADLLAALAAVDAGWVARLPAGLDTPLGAGGTALDAGQEQQVALARVVLADPEAVVLDEATSLLDPTTARVAERSMFAVLAGRTVIAIAHRLHTAHDADRVAVMERGRITECGTHDALIAADGAYAALWRSWHGAP